MPNAIHHHHHRRWRIPIIPLHSRQHPEFQRARSSGRPAIHIGKSRRRAIRTEIHHAVHRGKSAQLRGVVIRHRRAAAQCPRLGLDHQPARHAEHIAKRLGRSIMQKRRAGPHTEQAGRVDARESRSQPRSRTRPQRSHIMEIRGVAGVRVERIGVAGRALLALEHRLARDRGFRHQAVVSTVRALRNRRGSERRQIRGEIVHFLRAVGIRFHQRLVLDLALGQKSEAAEMLSDVDREILHLVEVRGPMQVAVSHAALAAQVDRVPQSLAALREIKHTPVVSAVHMAGRARNVGVHAHSVGRLVEDLLPLQNPLRELLRGRRADRRGRLSFAESEKRRQRRAREIAGEQVLNPQRSRLRIERHALRRGPRRNPQAQRAARRGLEHHRVEHRHIVLALQRDKQPVPERRHLQRHGRLAVVDIRAQRPLPRLAENFADDHRRLGFPDLVERRVQVDRAHHRPHRVLGREIGVHRRRFEIVGVVGFVLRKPTPAHRLVLLRDEPRHRMIRRDDHIGDVVRNAFALRGTVEWHRL